MLYSLLYPLAEKHDLASLFNLFRYITFRGGCALMTALVICFWMWPGLIRWLKSQQGEGQPIRNDGPETHFKKKGTPTMGGLMMLIAVIISTLLWMDLGNAYSWIVLLVTGGFGLIGFADDYLKLTRRNPKGVAGRTRLLGQLAIALCAALTILHIAPASNAGTLAVPFLKDFLWQLEWLFLPFAALVIVGSSNAVNLTDGLDAPGNSCSHWTICIHMH